jgi:hypothetical protein
MLVARVLAGFHIFLLTLRMAGERAPVVCQSHLQTSVGCNRNKRRKRAERMVIVDAICADMDAGSLIVSYRRRRSGTARALFEGCECDSESCMLSGSSCHAETQTERS